MSNNVGEDVPFEEIEAKAEVYANRRIGKRDFLMLDWMEAKQGFIKGWMDCYLEMLKAPKNGDRFSTETIE